MERQIAFFRYSAVFFTMKLRSRKTDYREPSTTASKRAKLDSFESIYPGMLISYGKYGKCYGSGCNG